MNTLKEKIEQDGYEKISGNDTAMREGFKETKNENHSNLLTKCLIACGHEMKFFFHI